MTQDMNTATNTPVQESNTEEKLHYVTMEQDRDATSDYVTGGNLPAY